jgi:hypothetical protein
MICKAFLKVRTHLSINHGESSVVDIPLGDYDSEDGPITVLERVQDVNTPVYFMIDLHEHAFPFEQRYNEFSNIFIRPKNVILQDSKEEIECVAFFKPDIPLAREVCAQWRTCNDKKLAELADMVLSHINACENSTIS